MRKIFTLIILSVTFLFADAQPFNNEWINYHNDYYKFYVGAFGHDQEGMPIRRGPVRIYQPVLASAGFQNIIGDELQLWKDGKEVPVYVSNNGKFSSSDYLEFWGEIATGKTDTELYEDATWQLSDAWNLYNDSAAYFLTTHLGNNLRIEAAVNDLSKVNLPPDRSFLFDTARYFHDEINDGYGVFLEQKLYQSSFSQNEGWTSRAVKNSTPMPQNFPQLYADSLLEGAYCYFSVAGNGPETREVRLMLNNDTLTRFSLEGFTSKKLTVPIHSAQLKSGTAGFRIENLSTVEEDEIKVGTLQIFYPRYFNFGGNVRFEFNLLPSVSGRYLKIANFDFHKAAVVLYDLVNLKRYYADTTLKDSLQFYLPPSDSGYRLALFKEVSIIIKSIPQVNRKKFIDFSLPANQGNYLMIYNKILRNGTTNSLEAYANYRESDTGGSFQVKLIDIDELTDQFAFGIQLHPSGIKNFLQFARNKFASTPAYVFLIGKGVDYKAYRHYGEVEFLKKINLIPVFGSPGSDNLLSSVKFDAVPATPIGRLSVVSDVEVENYLKKVKEFESLQRSHIQTLEEKGWMKKVLQLVGVNDLTIGATIDSMAANYGEIISDTAFGGNVITFSKYADSANYPNAVSQFTTEMNEGCGLLEYFGHSSSTNIDFNLDDPANYNNYGKYPLMIVNGCKAGNIFDYDPGRLEVKSSLSEKFVLENEKGAIGYLSSSNFGIVDYLDIFTKNFYAAITGSQYGKGIGNITKEGIADALSFTGYNDFYGKMHAEQFTFHGDPSLKIGGNTLPDYLVDSNSFELYPSSILLSSDSFTVKIHLNNIGKATNDSVQLLVSRTFPDGNSINIFNGNLKPLKSKDSVEFKLPIVYNRDNGKTKIRVTIDPENRLPEIAKTNNSDSLIFEMKFPAILPVYPYNFSIINNNPEFIASSLWGIDSLRNYKFEIDTNPFFNSPSIISLKTSAAGGLVQFKNIQLPVDSATYYWRVAEDLPDAYWSSFSFNYRSGSEEGFEQGDFFQHTSSFFNAIKPDSAERKFDFTSSNNNLFIQHSIYPTSGMEDIDFSVFLNGSMLAASACVGSSILFNVFDPLTFKPVMNTDFPYNAGPECRPLAIYNFEYSTQSPSTRKNAMDFLDYYVQNGFYVVARKVYDMGNSDWAPTVWAGDTAIYGKNNSLYHRLKSQGTLIDSFTYPRTFIFLFKKNDSINFKPVSVISNGLYDRITLSKNIQALDSSGSINSPLFGPAKTWKEASWLAEKPAENSVAEFKIYAKNTKGIDSLIYVSDSLNQICNLSDLDAENYPFIYFSMHSKDPETCIPIQLQHWGTDFISAPEGAIATNLGYNIQDSFVFKHDINTEKDTISGYLFFKNISKQNFNPLKVKIVMIDEFGKENIFPMIYTDALSAGEVMQINFNLDVSSYPEGKYNLYIEVNPDEDQPELYHFNNYLYKYIYLIREFVLPVQLLNFSAAKVNQQAKLSWKVTNEEDCVNYILLHSIDGIQFEELAAIPVKTPSQLVKAYQYIHTTPSLGWNYYKLKVNKKDGTYYYSSMERLPFQGLPVRISPNPFKDFLIVEAPQNFSYTVTVFDMTGKIAYSSAGVGSSEFDLANFASGPYIVQIANAGYLQSFKVIKY